MYVVVFYFSIFSIRQPLIASLKKYHQYNRKYSNTKSENCEVKTRLQISTLSVPIYQIGKQKLNLCCQYCMYENVIPAFFWRDHEKKNTIKIDGFPAGIRK